MKPVMRRHPLCSIVLVLLATPVFAQTAEASTIQSATPVAQETSSDEEPSSEAPLRLASISVTPERLSPDTLCQLRVAIENNGERIASQLAFEVTVEGRELPVYRNQLFMDRLDPEEVTEVRLYNFWTNETGRPVPTDGDLDVEVSLTEASWYSIVEKEEEGETIEEWTPLEPVSGLPSRQRVSLPFSRSPSSGEAGAPSP